VGIKKHIFGKYKQELQMNQQQNFSNVRNASIFGEIINEQY